jgi:glucosylceramidase
MRFTVSSFATTAVVLLSLSPGFAQTVKVIETRADATVLLGAHETAFTAGSPDKTALIISLDDTKRLQPMDGFGASLTDSSAALLMELPAAQRSALMHEIFDPAGPLGLTLLRQPIGASDFSAHGGYTYDDPPAAKPDPSLASFGTATDHDALFPLLREALHLDPQLRFMVLPWSAPAWMKDSHTIHAGSLENANLPVYAQYLARTVEAYAQQGLPVFALALQNEPLNENHSYPTQHMDPVQEARLAALLQPILRKDGRTPLLFGYEHNWDNLDYPSKLLSEAAQLTPAGAPPLFVGISFHCYAGDESAQLAFLRDHPSASIWFTECSGTNNTDFAADLLWQAHHLLLGAPLNGARSVLLWNLVLNPHGGPHNGGCENCRALFTVDPLKGTVHRNVEYYELAHAAPFIHPGATRIAALTGSGHEVEAVAFQNPDTTLALLVLNSAPRETRLAIQWHGQNAVYTAPARSLMTFTWGKPVPVLIEGAYRIAVDASAAQCLEATAGAAAPGVQPCSTEPPTTARQLWTLHRFKDGRYEVRNVATAQALGIASSGKLVTLTLDGSHIALLSMLLLDDGVCFDTKERSACAPEAMASAAPQAGNLLHLSAP